MKKKAALLLIQIFVVAIALALTVVTYAWYSTQTHADVTPTTVTAAAGPNTYISSMGEIENSDPYKGQTGLGYDGDEFGGVDKPYAVSRDFQVNFSPVSSDSYMKINISSIKITKKGDSEEDALNSADDPSIIDNFTWRAIIDNVTYLHDEDGFLYYETYNEILDTTTRHYYAIPSSTVVTIKFVLIFLSEESYLEYENENYESVTAFSYCSYDYMRAKFDCLFEIGMDRR